jgi:hypothetical protein
MQITAKVLQVLESLKFKGDTLFTDVETICAEFRRLNPKKSTLSQSAT